MADKKKSEAMRETLSLWESEGVKITKDMRDAVERVEKSESEEKVREILGRKILFAENTDEEQREEIITLWLNKLTALATEFSADFDSTEQSKPGRGNKKVNRHVVGFDLSDGSHLNVTVDRPVHK